MKGPHVFLLGFLVLLLTGCKETLIRHLAFFPEKVSDNLSISEPWLSEVYLTTNDGIKIHALFIESKGANKIVLFFHGNAGNAYHRIPDAYALSLSGINVLLVDYRGYGKSEGKPSEQGLYKDAEAAYDYLIDKRQYTPKDIFLLGRSIGTSAAIHLAQDRQPGGLILITPLSSGKQMATTMGLGWLSWLVGPVFDNIQKIRKANAPTLVIHGDKDEIIPFSMGEEIYKTAPAKNKQFMRIKGGGHNDLTQVAGPGFWASVGQFINDLE